MAKLLHIGKVKQPFCLMFLLDLHRVPNRRYRLSELLITKSLIVHKRPL